MLHANPSPLLGIARSVMGRGWWMRGCDDRQALMVSQRLAVPEVVARVLVARGVGVDEAAGFLAPRLRDAMPDPSVLEDMDAAARRVADAVAAGEKLAILGDYDVDGATSTALLLRFFRALGLDPLIHIPDRITEGYGPNATAMTSLKQRGASLVITVDCGAVSFEPLAHAATIGLDVLVMDHHMGEPRLPEAVAVVNPNRVDGASGLGYLAAVGVCFMLVVAVLRELRQRGFFKHHPEPSPMPWLDLVALGTVCDVVPLVGLNRAFVAQGLKIMAQRQNLGLRALSDIAHVSEAPTAYHCGFVLGPRINAGGRVGRAAMGAEILSTEDPAEALALAGELDRYNKERQAIEAMVLEEAFDQLEKRPSQAPVLFAYKEGWHPGVIGIAAGRIKERYYRPSAVIAFQDGVGKASARSVTGVDFGAAIHAARAMGLVEAGGGHAMAGGFTVLREKLDDLHQFLCNRMGAQVDALGDAPPLMVDATIAAQGITQELAETLAQAAPFGTSNPEPMLVIPHARILAADALSGGEHARLIVTDSLGKKQTRLKAMAFRIKDTPLAHLLPTLPGKTLHLAGKLRLNTWNGTTSAELLLEDIAEAA